MTASGEVNTETVVVISADTEWKAFKRLLPPDTEYHPSPFGQWCARRITEDENHAPVVFFHGGWGKIDAAASTQYAIVQWKPEKIINIGTAGGFPGKSAQGEILSIERTVTYDIHEKMGDFDEAIEYYSSEVPVPAGLSMKNIPRITIASGDQDLSPAIIPHLAERFNAAAGDWESSAIAHVAKKNGITCHIIRGISDVVFPEGSEAYGNLSGYERETEIIMNKLLELLPCILK